MEFFVSFVFFVLKLLRGSCKAGYVAGRGVPVQDSFGGAESVQARQSDRQRRRGQAASRRQGRRRDRGPPAARPQTTHYGTGRNRPAPRQGAGANALRGPDPETDTGRD